MGRQPLVRLGLGGVALDVAEPGLERRPVLGVGVLGEKAAERVGGVAGEVFERGRVHLGQVHADDGDLGGEVPLAVEVVERRDQLPVREVAGGAEEDELDHWVRGDG